MARQDVIRRYKRMIRKHARKLTANNPVTFVYFSIWFIVLLLAELIH